QHRALAPPEARKAGLVQHPAAAAIERGHRAGLVGRGRPDAGGYDAGSFGRPAGDLHQPAPTTTYHPAGRPRGDPVGGRARGTAAKVIRPTTKDSTDVSLPGRGSISGRDPMPPTTTT